MAMSDKLGEESSVKRRRRSTKRVPKGDKVPERVPKVITQNPGMSSAWQTFYQAFCSERMPPE